MTECYFIWFVAEFKLRQEAESIDSLKPPAYIRINKSKPVGNVKCGELDLSNATACECNPQKPLPCGADSNCINRLASIKHYLFSSLLACLMRENQIDRAVDCVYSLPLLFLRVIYYTT